MMMRSKLRVKNQIMYWENLSGLLTADDAQKIVDEIKLVIDEQEVKAIVVDNRRLETPWSTEVDQVWVDFMVYIPRYIDKTATICQNEISKLQMNYLSSQSGTIKFVQAFALDESDDIMSFLGVDALDINWE